LHMEPAFRLLVMMDGGTWKRKAMKAESSNMRRNVEIKARITDLKALTARVKSVADRGPELITQEDTFFHSDRGRLKLRKFSEAEGELIYYERPDSEAPAECRYRIIPTVEPDGVVEMLASSHGIQGVVRKKRTLYMTDQTRIHLDEVEGLGSFLELEVVLRPDQDAAEGVRIAEQLMDRLGIDRVDLVKTAYIDLLAERRN
jgi:predicted adenylyl cyclase CyaB